MSELPTTGGSGGAKENQDPMITSMSPLKDLSDPSTSQGAPEAPFEQWLSPEQIIEVAHGIAKETIRLKDEVEATVQISKARISALEKSERRLKIRLEQEKERTKDAETDLHDAINHAAILEEHLDNELLARKDAEKELDRYRRWWLTEYYSLKVALDMIVDPDDGVVAMRESSCARHRLHLASQSGPSFSV